MARRIMPYAAWKPLLEVRTQKEGRREEGSILTELKSEPLSVFDSPELRELWKSTFNEDRRRTRR